MLADAAAIQTHQGVSATVAQKVFRHGQPQAERWLRALKGDPWYDSLDVTPEIEPPGPLGVRLRVVRPVTGTRVVRSAPYVGLAGTAWVDAYATLDDPAWVPPEPLDPNVFAPQVPNPAPVQLDEVRFGYRLAAAGAEPFGAGGALAVPPVARAAWRRSVALPDYFFDGGTWALGVEARDAAGGVKRAAWSFVPVRDRTGAVVALDVAWLEQFMGAERRDEADDAALITRGQAIQAEALVCLYFALPLLNLDIREGGGIIAQTWTAGVDGARTQVVYATAAALDALRADLLDQARLLVGGETRAMNTPDAPDTLAVRDGTPGGLMIAAVPSGDGRGRD